MIVVRRKPIQDILRMIGNANSVVIAGCDGCAGIYQEGGQKQVEFMKIILEMSKQLKERRLIETKTAMVLRQCDHQFVVSSLRPVVSEGDVVLSLACGVGVQTVSDIFNRNIVVPALDTMFMGMQDREGGSFKELCRACGNCLLYETGGICPMTRCGKALINGPCGGQAKGKCEVGGWKKDCGWVLVYNRLKSMGRLDLMQAYRPPKDFRDIQTPREL